MAIVVKHSTVVSTPDDGTSDVSKDEWNAEHTITGTIDVVDDTTPQLGGDLDLNSHDITGTGNIDITGTVKVSDDAYDATDWNGNTEVPTKNAIRDKIESLPISVIYDSGEIVSPVASVTFNVPTDIFITFDVEWRLTIDTVETPGATLNIDIGGQIVPVSPNVWDTGTDGCARIWFMVGQKRIVFSHLVSVAGDDADASFLNLLEADPVPNPLTMTFSFIDGGAGSPNIASGRIIARGYRL